MPLSQASSKQTPGDDLDGDILGQKAAKQGWDAGGPAQCDPGSCQLPLQLGEGPSGLAPHPPGSVWAPPVMKGRAMQTPALPRPRGSPGGAGVGDWRSAGGSQGGRATVWLRSSSVQRVATGPCGRPLQWPQSRCAGTVRVEAEGIPLCSRHQTGRKEVQFRD